MLLHEHHIIPTHAGGTDDRTNILRCNIPMHAFLHKVRWMELGEWQDELAWKALSKQIGREEVHHRVSVEAGKMSKGRKIQKWTPERRAAKSAAMRKHLATHRPTTETLARLSRISLGNRGNSGRAFTDEHKEKIRQAMLRRNEAKRKVETYGPVC